MEPLDRNMQRRVWARVYPEHPSGWSPKQRQALQRCLARSKENLAIFVQLENHSLYGQAFGKLAGETREHMKMLQQMLK